MLFEAHTRATAALGGVGRRGIYDNMKTAVNKIRKDKFLMSINSQAHRPVGK